MTETLIHGVHPQGEAPSRAATAGRTGQEGNREAGTARSSLHPDSQGSWAEDGGQECLSEKGSLKPKEAVSQAHGSQGSRRARARVLG